MAMPPSPAGLGSETSAEPGALGSASYRAELDETEIITQHVPMVKRLAIHLKARLPEGVQVDDLIQAGLLAVLRIVRRAAARYADDALLRRAVRNAMIDEARRESWAPTRMLRFAKAAGAAMRAVKQRTGRNGSDEEIAAELGITRAQYDQRLIDVAGMRLFDLAELDEGCERALQIDGSQEDALHQSRVAAALAAAVASLPEREKLVVSLYYEHELNMEEIGEVLGLDKSTICRAHGRALLMLRNAMTEPRPTVNRLPQPAGA